VWSSESECKRLAAGSPAVRDSVPTSAEATYRSPKEAWQNLYLVNRK